MKIAVFSDSHRMTSGMIRAVELEKPDVIFHLGDYKSDTDRIREQFPDIPIHAVYGNCDFVQSGDSRIIVELEGKRIFAAHGHTYSVKLGLDSIVNTAMAAGADILLFGHTHRALEKEYEGLIIINPGAANPVGTYEIINIENSEVTYQCRNIP